jgi:hypothetical protein
MSLKRNIVWNLAGTGLPLLVGALTIPYLPRTTGVEAFGVLTLVWALIGYFSLFDFSAKWDPVPTMLCQNHTKGVKGFMGQTTAFNKNFIKSNVLIMGQNKSANEARYIHGELGKGLWTWYGGHDPEDYQEQSDVIGYW